MHIEGRAKAGFYPLPPRVTDLILKHIEPSPAGTGALLDACCGEGVAASTIACHLKLTSYGCEIHKGRVEASAHLLDQTLCSDGLSARIQREHFTVCLLNPPYDSEGYKTRSEDIWLHHMTGTLKVNGLMILVIQEEQCSFKLKQYLFAHFRRLHFFRFPEEEYERFNQIIVLGTRGQTSKTRYEIDRLAGTSIQWDELGSPDTETTITLPAGSTTADVFYSDWIDPEDQLREVREHGIWHDPAVHNALHFPAQQLCTPLMPVRKGHLVRMIAAGLLNNSLITTDTRRWAIKGSTTKTKAKLPSIEEEYETDKGLETREVERTIERFKPVVEAWDLTAGSTFGDHIVIDC